MESWKSDESIVEEKPGESSVSQPGRSKGLAVIRRGTGRQQPYTERERLLETKLDLIAKRAKQEPGLKFTSLAHLLDEAFLAECYRDLKKGKAPGIDGMNVEEYGKDLEKNLRGLVERMKGQRYRPLAVRRAYIPKGNDQVRPLGIPAVEDKVVQRGMARILEGIFEGDFLEVSYGFRPGRGCHDALEVFDRMVLRKPINYVIEVDIEGYYDHIDHGWLMKCLQQRIVDPSFLRLIHRTLKAGVMEEGRWRETEEGAPQGGMVSPILSNIYLHYVLDLWFERKVKKGLRGYAELIRYADDFVIGCQKERDAYEILSELKERLRKFGLRVSEEKTGIVEMGRYAQERARKRGLKRPGTVEFLGFTHFGAKDRRGYAVGRRTSGKRFRAKLKAMNEWLKQARNQYPLPEWWRMLCRKLKGHYQYYGVTGNWGSIARFYWHVERMTFKWWNRRSQRRSGNWEDFRRRLGWNPLPKPRIVHKFRVMPAT